MTGVQTCALPILIVSLLATASLCILYAFTMNFAIAMFVWIGLSFSTAFVFWSSLMKAIRLIGTEEEQGFMYGLYYACNGITLALTNSIALKIFAASGDDISGGFVHAVLTGAVVEIIAAVLLFFLMDNKSDSEADDNEPKFHFSDVGKLLKNPVVWTVSLTIFCGYGFYSCVSYFNPYLTQVRGLSLESSGFVSVARNYLTLLLAPIGGLIADKLFKSTCKWLATAFLMLSALFAAVLILPAGISPMAASLYTLIPGAVTMMMYGVVFSTVSEAGIPRAMTGTVIGIASIIGYMPDSIYSVLFGKWLDEFGNTGYTYIFGFLAVSGIVGAILAMTDYKLGKKNAKKMSEAA